VLSFIRTGIYSEIVKKFPEIGSIIKTAKGTGILKKIDIFEEAAVIQHENHDEEKINLRDLETVLKSEKEKQKPKRKSKISRK
jgi:cell fate regulator YaaT (PSP1 superfamily)